MKIQVTMFVKFQVTITGIWHNRPFLLRSFVHSSLHNETRLGTKDL